MNDRTALLVFYDEGCALCRRVVSLLSKAVDKTAVRFIPANDLERYTQDKALLDTRYVNMVGVAGGHAYQGYDTYVEIAARSSLLRPIRPFLACPLVRRIGIHCYQRVAGARTCRIS